MAVDACVAGYRAQLVEQGYALLPATIPPQRLASLRQVFETLAERQFARWESDPDPKNQWPVGFYAHQPRILIQSVVDESTSDAIEFCLSESTLGMSRELMQAPDAAPTLMSLMCNPAENHGPDNWHRDIRPSALAPLAGLQADARANGPACVQWNIPLYDDAVLWVVPGSHWRLNTAEENDALTRDLTKPLPGGIPVELAAGDAVVYFNTMLHWGSNYGTKRRRTIHLGYRAFGGAIYPHANGFNWDLEFTVNVSGDVRQQFERFCALHEEERRVIESVLRAVLHGDAELFRKRLAVLHLGDGGRMVALVLTSKLVNRLQTLASADRYGFDLRKDIADAFTPSDREELQRRFASLDVALRADGESAIPGFQEKRSEYELNSMPERFGLEEFVASWGSAA